MPWRDGQRQQHFIFNQLQHRQRRFGCDGICTVINQIIVRPILSGRYQLQPATYAQRDLDAAKATLATQYRLAGNIQLQPRLALIVPLPFQPNRQVSFRCGQQVCQTRQFIQADATIQHTTTARELKTVYDSSGN